MMMLTCAFLNFKWFFFVIFWQEFLRSEFSEENLLFWIKCEEYKKLNDANQVN